MGTGPRRLYLAFLGLTAGTTIVFINSDVRWALQWLFDVDIYFLQGDFYIWFKTIMDVCFLVLVGGMLAAGFRRGIVKPKALTLRRAIRGRWETWRWVCWQSL